MSSENMLPDVIFNMVFSIKGGIPQGTCLCSEAWYRERRHRLEALSISGMQVPPEFNRIVFNELKARVEPCGKVIYPHPEGIAFGVSYFFGGKNENGL